MSQEATIPEVDDRVLRVVQSGMGNSGKMDYPEVAEAAGIQTRTLKEVGEHTTVRTLRKIATGLGFELVIRIEAYEKSTATGAKSDA